LDSNSSYDALIVIGFGGPEKREEVIPFLENVLRGRNVPRERMLAVAEHYYHFGGRSPINDQNRKLIAAVQELFDREGPRLPVYWGNRNWHPLLPDTVAAMQHAGVKRALGFVTSVFSSYSGCRQYLDALDRARATVGPAAPEIHKLRICYNHPGFIEAMADRLEQALAQVPEEERATVPILYSAHSIPESMARNCSYEAELQEACALISQAVGRDRYQLVYQSRSGPPDQPWLEPDIGDALRRLKGIATAVIVVPVGFVSDHMEVLYDLDTEAIAIAQESGIRLVRAKTAGSHPKFVRMIRDLVMERLELGRERSALGTIGARPDFCPPGCCPASSQPGPNESTPRRAE
jgi:ferrochelatase